MNLYDYHNDPTTLLQYDKVYTIVQQFAIDEFWKTINEIDNIGKGIDVIAISAYWSFRYAEDVIQGRFPEGEKAIASSDNLSYQYAYYILNDRFPLGEKTIAKNPNISYQYAQDVIQGRFEEGEKAMKESSGTTYWKYYTDMLRDKGIEL